MIKLAPSILAADFSKLGEEVRAVEKAGAHLIHIDVMDGCFVPNISFGACVMKSLCGKSALPFDVHLMIESPDRYIGSFVTETTESITVHQEACPHLHRTIGHIKSFGVKAGVAINPATPAAALDCVLANVDLVMVMAVNPGFSGQAFIPQVIDKIYQISESRKENGFSFEIEVDGGVLPEHVWVLEAAGADIIVGGKAVFAGGNIEDNVKALLFG
ncbi:MAG: ribulose-phosphate 3-epimerase [Clostridiales bacterium]|nr:ribulose-phosphate 3-epimerase [Clostridiales bacterium]